MLILVLVVVGRSRSISRTAFMHTANAVATSIATGRVEAAGRGVDVGDAELRRAFISFSVAATIAKGIVNPAVTGWRWRAGWSLAALIGAILWNLITWYLTIPSSSSHALIGGVIGATVVAAGSAARSTVINWCRR